MFIVSSPVITIITLLGLALIISLVTPSKYAAWIRQLCLITSFAALCVSLLMSMSFDKMALGYQFVHSISFVAEYNTAFAVGVDGLSYIFLVLTLFTFPFLFLAAWAVNKLPKHFFCYLLSMELLLVLTFVTIDLFYFYIFFESMLIPMFILIGVWGARARRIKAANYFFLYTLVGSLFVLFAMLYIYSVLGTLNYVVLLNHKFALREQLLLWPCFFLAFAVKMPLFPFHIWLPEAHVEAPTVGSMLLASLLLKLGGYGFLRFSLTFLADASVWFYPVVTTLGLAGVIYSSLSTLRQADLKRIIAYSSVAHMNFVVLGLFSFARAGLDGAIYLMVAHGITSTALFFCIGILYDSTHTRLVYYYGGLGAIAPVFASAFFLFTFGNMGFPGTPGFIGEFLTMAGILNQSVVVAVFAATSVVTSAAYGTLLANRVLFGTVKTTYVSGYVDANRLQVYTLFGLIVSSLITGVCASSVLPYATHTVSELVAYYEPHTPANVFNFAVIAPVGTCPVASAERCF